MASLLDVLVGLFGADRVSGYAPATAAAKTEAKPNEMSTLPRIEMPIETRGADDGGMGGGSGRVSNPLEIEMGPIYDYSSAGRIGGALGGLLGGGIGAGIDTYRGMTLAGADLRDLGIPNNLSALQAGAYAASPFGVLGKSLDQQMLEAALGAQGSQWGVNENTMGDAGVPDAGDRTTDAVGNSIDAVSRDSTGMGGDPGFW
jgi:hypothetical protein